LIIAAAKHRVYNRQEGWLPIIANAILAGLSDLREKCGVYVVLGEGFKL
jgi:hypothetical protein